MIFQYVKDAVSNINQKLDKLNDTQNENDIIYLIELIKNNSISCNSCNALSAPIYNSKNNYRCVKCGRQFHGHSHFIKHTANELIKSKSILKNSVDAEVCYNKALTRI